MSTTLNQPEPEPEHPYDQERSNVVDLLRKDPVKFHRLYLRYSSIANPKGSADQVRAFDIVLDMDMAWWGVGQ
jgi:hypothetical protein